MTMINDRAMRFICFDLGGVLVRTQHDIFEACATAGLTAAAGWRSGSARRSFAQLLFRLESGGGTDEEFLREAAAILPPWEAADVAALMDVWLLGLYPGVPQLLSELAAAPHRLTGCLSNTNERHCRIMLEHPDYRPLQQHLDHRFFSHRIGARKPAGAIYEHVEQHVAEVSGPEAILFFDDRAENIDAARERGWLAELIDPHGDPAQQIRACLTDHGVL